jgi:hypothetical protein
VFPAAEEQMRPFEQEDPGLDVYENDDIIDRFMDDIDEGTMCEGSR